MGLLACGVASGDELRFKNGDRLTGTVVSLAKGKLVFDSAVAGELSIDPGELQTFSTAEPIELHLADGTVESDAIVASDEEGVVTLAGEDPAEPRSVRIEEAVSINPEVWSGSILGGAVLSRGNADKDTANGDLLLQRQTERHRFTLDAGYQGSRERASGVAITTRRRVFGGLKLDRYLTERFYTYASSRGERDGVNNLDLRLTSGGGVGYDWWTSADFELSTEAGLAWVSEFYSDETDDDGYPGANVLWRLRRALFDPVDFFHRGTWVPSLVERDNHLLDTETGLRVGLTKHVFGEAKMRWRWDSEPAEDTERSDFDWILGLGLRY